jgi:hypothetical protein
MFATLHLHVLGLALVCNVVAASFTADLTIGQCDMTGCKPVQKRVALDATSNGTEQLISVNGAGFFQAKHYFSCTALLRFRFAGLPSHIHHSPPRCQYVDKVADKEPFSPEQ